MTDKKNTSTTSSNLVVASEVFPENILILPMSQRPMFPGMTMPLLYSGEEAELLQKAYKQDEKIIGAVFAKEYNKNAPNESTLYDVGTILKIHKFNNMEGVAQALVQGVQRFKLKKELQKRPYLEWQVEHLKTPANQTEEIRAYTLTIINAVKQLLQLNPLTKEQLNAVVSQMSIDKPGLIMDLVASMLTVSGEKLQQLLEAVELEERAQRLLNLLKEEIEVNKLKQQFKEQIDEKISEQQREYFLKEQLKAIKEELGMEKDEKAAEVETFEKRIEQLDLTEEAEKVINDELGKLKMLPPQAQEYHVTRAYLEWLTELPWGNFSEDNTDIKKAEKVLDKHHYGLEDVKDRILEYISTIIKRGKLTGSILLFVGPPGVGKTSIGHSIADALGRKFYRFSVGGMRDEAEIKGHRRTYIGAMPGKFIQSLKRTGTANPVIMIDEVDKIGQGFRGDPASALLEVLDPEQNKEFLDHYLDVRFDLSKVLFITTANVIDTIPAPLLNRMEVIRLSGYITQEKVEIAKKHLIPELLEEHGLDNKDIIITKAGLNYIIDHYAREAGVRILENQLKKIMRKVTRRQAEGKNDKVKVTEKNVEEFLGKKHFKDEELYNIGIAGVALGLAYTSMGGASLYIEANAVKTKKFGFKQTGQLGQVMEESSEIAYSYIRALLDKKEAYKEFFENNFIHLHVPAGATPKDGPSAGITMALALYSLATDSPVRNDIAMTGELTLTGKVLPIGGVKEKLIAAKRVEMKDIILPVQNQPDFEELQDYVKEGINVHFADYFDDVLEVVFKDKSKHNGQEQKSSSKKKSKSSVKQ